MATPFVRVDLSPKSRDFEFLVLDAGVPLLDPRGAHYQMLRKWLKGQVAEPEVRGQQAAFYVRSDAGARLENVKPVPVTEADLDGPLRKELETLIAAIQKAEAKSRDEEAVLRVARDELLSLTTQQKKRLRCSYFFKYQDQGKPKLVWCAGYRRKDQDPSAPLICYNPNCLHLYVRKPNVNDCPVCKAPPVPQPGQAGTGTDRRPGGGFRKALVFALLLLIAAGAVGVWYQFFRNPQGQGPGRTTSSKDLVITPETWSGPVGSRVEFTVKQPGEKGEVDVTKRTLLSSSDPNVLFVDGLSTDGQARSPGKAQLTFKLGELKREITVTVEVPEPPKNLTLEPGTVALGIGTTARLKLMGEYGDGRKVDLTDSAQWVPSTDGLVFSYRGLLEGLEEGEGTVRARYRASSDAKPMEATAKVTVAAKKYEDLTLSLDPLSIAVGQVAEVTATVKPESGEPLTVSESSLLKLTIEPEGAATIQGRRIYATKPGSLKITGSFQGLEDAVTLEVKGEPETPSELDVQPKTLAISVGEVATLAITAPQGGFPVRVVSAAPGTVEVLSDNRLVGRAEGSAKVEVMQGDKESVTVDVTVAKAEPKSVAFVPANLSVRVDDTAAVRVVATLESGRTFDVAPDALDWTSFPRPDYATLDKATLKVKGLKGTGEDHETLAVRFAGKDARADLQVVSAPARLELEPAGPVTIPVGQQQPFKVFASYGDGQRQEVSADRIEWKFDAPSGLVLRDGTIHAEADGQGPLPLSAGYGESTSNVVQVSSGPPVPLTLQLAARPNTLGVNQSGEIEVTGNSPGGAVAVSTAGFTFESSDANVLVVDPATGAFRAQQPGAARVIAKPPMGDAAEVEVTVSEVTPEPRGPDIASVRIVPAGDKPVVASVGVEVAGFKVETVDEAGKATDRTADALLSVVTEPDAEVSPIMARDGRLIAVLPGEAQITASVDGVPAEKPLPVTVSGELQVDEIRVTPKSVVLALGESIEFEAEGFLDGQSIGMISDHPKVQWEARTAEGLLDETVRAVIATGTGTGAMTAQFGSVVSNPAEITIVESKDEITTPLVAAPETLRMEVGETRNVGSDVRVTRGTADFSASAEVAPANTGIVRFDPDLRRLVAIAPGRTRVTYSAGGQLASQDVEVVPSTAPPKDAKLELSPNGGRIGVGERVSIQAMQVCDSCNQRRTVRTGLLGLTSSDPAVCAVDGTTLVGMKPGQVEVTGKLPGIDAPATATFTVVDDPYQRIVIQPGQLDLALGQQRTFQVFGITDTGRRELADHPNLQITLEDNKDFAELSASARTVRGLSPGKATLVAKWKDLQDKVEIEVNGDPVSALRIDPADGSGTVGQMQSFQTFARRGTEWLPVSQSEGVSMQSSDPTIARIAPDGRVEALQAGTALLTANYGGQRAEARVTVTQTSQPAPRGRPLGLMFVDLTFRMTLGSPGDNLRVVRFYADGFEEDVGHLVTLTARDPKDVVTITASGQGPVVAPARLGQTQLDAELDDLRSVLPLLVEVIEALPQQARLLVTPNPVQLRVGESRPIQRVEVVPPRGGNPVEVPYRLTASDSPILDVDDATKTITGRRDGVAMARVTVVDPNSKYDGMEATVVVEVGATPGPSSQAGSPAAPRLSLTGPSSTTVGAEVQLRAELIVGSQSTDVTGEAILSVSTDDAPKVEIQTGCKLVARQPGTVRISARNGDQVSNVHELRIDPPATSFERLELRLGSPQVSVGERRPYELWGHPRGGGPRQDLTGQIGDNSGADGRPKIDFTTVAPEGGMDLVTHRAPAISGAKPGRVRVQASLGALQSDAVDLSIVDEPPNQPIALRIEPQQLTLREGDQSPDFRVLVRHRGADTFREIDNAALSSGDSALLAAVPDAPRKFAAAKPGETTVTATFGGLSNAARVKIITDRFRTITPKLEIGRRGSRVFALTLDIHSTPSAEKLEYRVVNPETQLASDWVKAAPKGEDMAAVVVAKDVPLGPEDKNYRLILESQKQVAQDQDAKEVERYPYSFKIRYGDTDIIRTDSEK